MNRAPFALLSAASLALSLSACRRESPKLEAAAEPVAVHQGPAAPLASDPNAGRLPPGHPPIESGGAGTAAPPAAPPGSAIRGKVVETLEAEKYTYLKVATGQGEPVWTAVPKATVAVGQDVSVENAMQMKNFASKNLNRTFEVIWFGTLGSATAGGAAPPAAAPAPPAAAPAPQAAHGTSAPAGHGTTAPPEAAVAVEPATGEGAHTIAAVHEKVAALVGATVRVRGKVVKVNDGILGRNWLHLQDGTGDAKAGTHDLTITTQERAAVGDVVTVTGKVARDRDFGAGYKYAVIVEDAVLVAPSK